jgi:uncharacterized protein (DUF1684 family)
MTDDWAAHRADILRARAERELRLRSPTGWLSLVGLHWLREGEQRFGGATTNEIVLRAEGGDLPPVAGILAVVDGRVMVRPVVGAGLTANGRVVTEETELVDDEQEAPTTLELASLRLQLIRRGQGRLGLRVRDAEAPALRAFHGLSYFDIDPARRLSGRILPASPGATLAVPDVLGDVNDEPTPGVVELVIEGQPFRLHALESMPGHLWLVFGDATNGTDTYGGGRFLVTGEVQPDGGVEVDFNLAYNPPCAFSPYATCPLPPEGNRLPMRIEAGERA